MSIAEELHKAIDELSEERQHELLNTARQRLQEQAELTNESPVYQELLNKLLIKRYEYHKAHPEKAITTEEAARRIRLKYGWND